MIPRKTLGGEIVTLQKWRDVATDWITAAQMAAALQVTDTQRVQEGCESLVYMGEFEKRLNADELYEYRARKKSSPPLTFREARRR